MAFYQLLIESAEDEVLIKNGLDPNKKVTHWGWYYPVSNYVFSEGVKKRTMTSVMNNIAKLIWSYENSHFPAKFSIRLVRIVLSLVSVMRHKLIHGCD